MGSRVPPGPGGGAQGCLSSSSSPLAPGETESDILLSDRGVVGGKSTQPNFRFCSLMKQTDPLRAGGGRENDGLYGNVCHHFLSRRFVALVRGEEGWERWEVEDLLFGCQLDANAAECFVITSLITRSIIT